MESLDLTSMLSRGESKTSRDGAVTYVVNDFRNAIIERKSHEEAVDIIIHYADQLHRCGGLEEVKRLYRKAAEDLGQNFGRHHSSTLFVTFERGRLLQHVRQFQTAERMYNRVLRGMEHRNPYQLYFSNELGVVYAEQHELLKAERAFQKALHGFTESWGADNLWAYTAAINLSDIYQTQGKLEEATILLHRGLSGLAKEFGVSHAVIMAKAPKFVKIYRQFHAHEQLDSAREVCELALIIFEAVFGRDSEEALEVAWDLAHISREQGNPRESKKLMDRVIAGLRQPEQASKLLNGTESVCS